MRVEIEKLAVELTDQASGALPGRLALKDVQAGGFECFAAKARLGPMHRAADVLHMAHLIF